jgi:hypothetical protein
LITQTGSALDFSKASAIFVVVEEIAILITFNSIVYILFKHNPSHDFLVEEIDDETADGEAEMVQFEDAEDAEEEASSLEAGWVFGFNAVNNTLVV